MIKLEDINYQNVEELFGMSGPYLGDVYLQGRKLKGRFLVHNDKYSDDEKYLLLCRFRGEVEIQNKIFGFLQSTSLVKDFRIVVIDRATDKKYQSTLIEDALYIVKMHKDEITYHQAFHDRIQDFEKRIKFNREFFQEIADKEIYE